MRLTSIAIRNYRVHRDLRIALDASRTLIGGPNESGKSTLVEAAHRVLFLRAKGAGRDHRAMVSDVHIGHPEVEMEFEARGKSWHVQKRFSGASGTVKLTEAGGATLAGDEAEAKLRGLLGIPEEAGKATEQWAHLWVWQGSAGGNPTEHANAHGAALQARLQKNCGAVAMQSVLDAKVAASIAAECEDIFKQSGEAKAASLPGRAQAEAEEAAQKLEAAREAAKRLEQAVTDFRRAGAVIGESSGVLQKLRGDQEEVERRAARIAELSGDEKGGAARATMTAGDYKTLAAVDKNVRTLREDIRRRTEALAPGEAEARRAAEHESACKGRHAEAGQEFASAGDCVRAARLHSELAAAHGQRLERTELRERLHKKQAEVAVRCAELAAQETKLAQLPQVNAAALKKLHALDSECAAAEAALAAMAAELKVVACGAPVELDGRALAAGEAHIITEDTEVTVGGATRLRIRPGGGTSLTDARRRVQDAAAARQRALDGFGLRSVADAVEAGAHRQQLETELKRLGALLKGMGADSLDDEVKEAEKAAASAEAEVQRRAAAVPDFPAPADAGAAAGLATECRRKLQDSEEAEATARAKRDAAETALTEAQAELAKRQQSLESERKEIAERDAQLRYLLQTYGEDAARESLLAERAAARDAAEAVLAQTRRALAAQQPEMLEDDRKRLARALQEQTAARDAAEQLRAAAQSLLHRDGTSDPHADLALAEARARAAEQRRAEEDRRARAVQLLHGLFREEQQALADQFTRPLAEKVSGYLECLFGPGARAEVRLENNEFTSLQLVSPAQSAGAFAFETLSGGTKEQLAAAMRLAMAEVLAETHDGCLPVVLDDAFAYADPQRVQLVQRMLDLAAARGLQVIVLTCDPAGYAALGAKQILLGAAPGAPLP